MVSLANGILGVNTEKSGPFATAKPKGSVDSFAQQLNSAMEGHLAKTGSSTHSETTPSGQTSASERQLTVAAKKLDTITAPATRIATSTPASTTVVSATTTPVATTATPTAVANPAAAVSTSATVLTAAQKAQMTPTEAYWASQPPAVQVLQTTPDDQKADVAQRLANQGYAIDVPIMVWGDDPLATMIERQTAGYTWVPSAMQPSIQEAPGVGGVTGANPYDPSSPPAGSIPVSTAFAMGTNISSDAVAEMWIQGQSFTVGSPNVASS